MFSSSPLHQFSNSQFPFGILILMQKNFLILHPLLENSKTRITIMFFFGKTVSNFASLSWKLDNRWYHNLQLCIQYRPNQGHLKPGPWPNGYPDKIYKPRILASLPNCKNNNRFCINITKYVNFLLLFCRISLRKIVDIVNW